jgi:hypothetical protein
MWYYWFVNQLNNKGGFLWQGLETRKNQRGVYFLLV